MYHSYVESNFFKKDTNELTYKTETDLQISRTNLWLPEGKRGRRDKSEAWDEHMHPTTCKIDNHQGPTV